MSGNDLGEYLRSRRAAVSPAEVGLPNGGRRRVSGLRRPEVAALAGINVDYYTRLEQGRERRPSPQVVDALATALTLHDDARHHLFRLAGLTPRERRDGDTDVDPALLSLLDTWPHNPAFVYDRAYDVLAGNALANALFPQWAKSANMLHAVFTDPDAKRFYVDWPVVARDAVADFRHGLGVAPDDARILRVRDELLAASPEFAELWVRNDVRRKSRNRKSFHHPRVGALTLTVHTFDVRSSPGQQLVVYHAEPGSPSAAALRQLTASSRTT